MSIAPIEMLAHFAVYSAVEVLAAFALSVTLSVPFLSFGRRTGGRRTAQGPRGRPDGGRGLSAGLDAVSRLEIRHRRLIMACGALALLGSPRGEPGTL